MAGPPDDFRSVARVVREECLAFRIRRLNRRVTRIYEAALRPHGLRITQLNILIALGLNDWLAANACARALDLERSTFSRNLRRLIDRRWVSVTVPAGGVAHELRLTAAGRRMVERALPAWREAQLDAAVLVRKAAQEGDKVVPLARGEMEPGER